MGSVTGGIVNSVLGGYGAYYSSGSAGINSSGIAQGGPCAGFWKELATFAGIVFIVVLAMIAVSKFFGGSLRKIIRDFKGSEPGNSFRGSPQGCGGGRVAYTYDAIKNEKFVYV